jgi:hypothetical protein
MESFFLQISVGWDDFAGDSGCEGRREKAANSAKDEQPKNGRIRWRKTGDAPNETGSETGRLISSKAESLMRDFRFARDDFGVGGCTGRET